MEKIGTYELSAALTSEHAGYSIWGFGRKNGRDYFIKQFIEMKYPADDTVSSPERIQRKLRECERFERRKKAIYEAINANSDGNAVRIEEFFRIGSKYYISMRKIESLEWGYPQVSALPFEQIRLLCSLIAHGVASLHKGRLIHADLKPDNVLFMKTGGDRVTAKIIDFDSGFLETDPPAPGETIVGDFHYFSPEACRWTWGEETPLTCKMDIFALGVMFHQYFTGELPGFDRERSSYSGEAAAKGDILRVSDRLPPDIRELLSRMLDNDPERRPTAEEVFNELRVFSIPEPEPEPHDPPRSDSRYISNSDWFISPGDL